MECMLLPNSLFDDGSLDCKTFTVVQVIDGEEQSYHCEFDSIKIDYPQHVAAIEQAAKDGKHYISIEYCKFEIQWD